MKKALLCLLLISAMLLTLASCGDSKNKPSDTTDASGAGEAATLSQEEAAALMSNINGENIEDFIDSDTEDATMAIADGLIKGEEHEIKVELKSDGTPKNPTAQENYKNIIDSGKYTMNFVIKTLAPSLDESGASVQEELVIPVCSAVDGKKFYFEAKPPISETGSMRVNFFGDGESCYLVIPSMKSYMLCDNTMLDEYIPDTDKLKIDSEYVSTTEVTYEGVTYLCENYRSSDSDIKYYFLNDELKRVEIVPDTGETTIMDITSISSKVDESLFVLPPGYIDISALMGTDFDLSDLG